ncbi:glycosyltransferase family 2 protein [Pseudoroseicyclus sp. H15]
MTGVTCLLPAYNEAARIGPVLQAALACPEIGEVIVIDDGSTDGTAELAESFAAPHLRVLRQPRNGGKARAIAAGLRAARGTYVMFLDSDLTGLTPDDLSRLASPVLTGEAGASISLRGNAPAPWRAIGLDYISGERVMPFALLEPELTAIERLPAFGLEVFLNRLWLSAGLSIAVVAWPDVASPLKSRKYGLLSGLRADAGMMRDIFRTIGPFGALGQIRALGARRV